MLRKRSARTAGFTLVELMIVLSLMGTVAASVIAVLKTSTRAIQVGSLDAYLESRANQTLDRITERLRCTALTTITPALSTPFSSPQIDFQPSIGYAGGATVWGNIERIAFAYRPGELNDGIDNDRDGLVDDGRVVWTRDVGLVSQTSSVWSEGVREYLDREVLNGKDDNGNGLIDERGLCFTVNGTSVVVQLTMQARNSSGVILTRTVQGQVFFRNR